MFSIKKLNEFRLLKEFKKHFAIDDQSVIAYANTIYTNRTLPRDVIVHEVKHLEQQKRYGIKTFINRYINDRDFRLAMEKEAYQAQLASIEDEGLREAVRLDCIEGLVSGLYGNITRAEAEAMLPKPKKNDVNKLLNA